MDRCSTCHNTTAIMLNKSIACGCKCSAVAWVFFFFEMYYEFKGNISSDSRDIKKKSRFLHDSDDDDNADDAKAKQYPRFSPKTAELKMC